MCAEQFSWKPAFLRDYLLHRQGSPEPRLGIAYTGCHLSSNTQRLLYLETKVEWVVPKGFTYRWVLRTFDAPPSVREVSRFVRVEHWCLVYPRGGSLILFGEHSPFSTKLCLLLSFLVENNGSKSECMSLGPYSGFTVT